MALVPKTHFQGGLCPAWKWVVRGLGDVGDFVHGCLDGSLYLDSFAFFFAHQGAADW
jgi:hypothetical protein